MSGSSSIFNHNFAVTIGYYSEIHSDKLTDFSSIEKRTTIANIAAIIPGIGSIIGVVRIIAGLIMLHDARPPELPSRPLSVWEMARLTSWVPARNRAMGYIARGAFEVVGGGSVLWIADIAFTFMRNHPGS